MTKFSRKEVLEATLKYFNGDQLATDAWIGKYCLMDNENNLLELDPSHMHKRISKEFARIEKKKFKTPLSEEKIYGLLDKFKYIVPQGSPMFGIGNDYQIVSLSNCYLLDQPLDCYSSILEVDKQLVNISKRRGGVGIDLDNLRPEGTWTNNSAKTSSGMVGWMRRYSNSIREVGQSGRRGALMLTLSVNHPDIVKFCTIKNDPTEVTGANVSVKLTREFVEALEKNEDFLLKWPVNSNDPRVIQIIKAKELWDTIINCAWLRAEPGILAWYNTLENTPADCYEEYCSIGTNPCSELNLHPLDSCRLLCLNLFSYVKNPFTKESHFDWQLFHDHAKIAQRLMDDMVDLESEKIDKILEKIYSDPEPDYVKQSEIDMWKTIKKYNDEGRRTGTGIVGLGDCLAALGIKYGSDLSIEVTEQIYETLKIACYSSSIEMATELGTFVGFDWEKEKNCQFFKNFPEKMLSTMSKFGRRNVSLLTTAPTGTVSLMTQTTSGIEPLFMMSYTRRKKVNHNDKNVKVDFIDQNGDSWQEYEVYHKRVEDWMKVTGETDLKKSPWYNCCAEDIDWINRVRLQAAAQKHVCHSISSTINLPENVTREKISEIYLTAFKSGCKGMTVYRKNCRSGVLIDKKTKKENNAPKRPKVLPCDIFSVKVSGQKYFVVVGLLNEKPYEVFSAKLNFALDHLKNRGTLEKETRGKYKLKIDDQVICENVCESLNNEEEIVTRLISTNLRHNVDLNFLVHQVEKTKGDLNSLSKAIARCLKKYIENGAELSGEECSECGGKLVRSEGCVSCTSCSFSKCG